MHGGTESKKKSKMLPRFYEGAWESNGTISRNQDIRESYGCVFKGEKERMHLIFAALTLSIMEHTGRISSQEFKCIYLCFKVISPLKICIISSLQERCASSLISNVKTWKWLSQT